MSTQPILAFSLPTSRAVPAVADDATLAEETLDANAEALEISVHWGDNTLLVRHLTPPRSFAIGEGTEFPVAPELIGGLDRCEIVRCEGSAVSVLNRDTTVRLQPGETQAIQVGELTLRVGMVRAGRKIGTGLRARLAQGVQGAHRHIGLSFVLHAAIVGSLAFFMPHMGSDDAEASDRDQFLTMQKLLNASAEAERERLEDQKVDQGESGGAGERAQGESGKMGTTAAVKTAGRFQKEGPRDNPKPELSRAELREVAKDFGMNGLLAAMAMKSAGPVADWAPPDGRGRDAQSFDGLMWATEIGDATGAGGLDLFGTGSGGGGKGVGVGLGPLGTIGHGQGDCAQGDCQGLGKGDKDGWGRSSGLLKGTHQVRNIRMTELAFHANGRLPPEVIQRAVRANFGRFRGCYESALRTNPSLTGRVAVKFVIDRTGAVSTAQDGGSDLPDQGVIACVVRSFGNLSFAQPEGGIVTVTYPIQFAPN
jgi:hypothetical protein